jgi:hypothetical protein
MKTIYIVQSIQEIETGDNLTRVYKAFAKKEDAMECIAEVGHVLDEYVKLLPPFDGTLTTEEEDKAVEKWDENHPFCFNGEHQATGWELVEVEFIE